MENSMNIDILQSAIPELDPGDSDLRFGAEISIVGPLHRVHRKTCFTKYNMGNTLSKK
jgi:hypothetical protein